MAMGVKGVDSVSTPLQHNGWRAGRHNKTNLRPRLNREAPGEIEGAILMTTETKRAPALGVKGVDSVSTPL